MSCYIMYSLVVKRENNVDHENCVHEMGTEYNDKNPNYTKIAHISNDFTDENHISYLGTPHKMCDTHI